MADHPSLFDLDDALTLGDPFKLFQEDDPFLLPPLDTLDCGTSDLLLGHETDSLGTLSPSENVSSSVEDRDTPSPAFDDVPTEDVILEVHNYCLSGRISPKSAIESIRGNSKAFRPDHKRNGSTTSSPDGSVDELLIEEFDEDDYSEPEDEGIVQRKSSRCQPGVSRRKVTMERVLTDEEKRLLSKEGVTNFPESGAPLTKQEEKVLRKVRRKIRNKKSAQCSRQRKKEYVEDLEKKYQKCSSELSVLKKELFKLKKENSSLINRMRGFLGRSTNDPTDTTTDSLHGQASFKTSFLVLCLSFFLVIFPLLTPDTAEDRVTMGMIKEGIPTGRHLLMASNYSPNDLPDLYDGHYSGILQSAMNSINSTTDRFFSTSF